MTIDGIDILADYGLKLLNIDGLYDFPARKKTTDVTGTNAKDIVFEPQKVTLKFKGVFASKDILISQIKAFETLLKSSLSHLVYPTAHGVYFYGAVADGFDVKTYWQFNAVVVTVPFTVVQESLP